MTRQIQPEILDSLPQSHPDAVASRRDLRWINAIMRNHAWLLARVRTHIRPGDRIVELGAGDGTLARKWACNAAPDTTFTAVDRQPAPADWPDSQRLQWIQADLSDPQSNPPAANILIFNLILHHFTETELRKIVLRWGAETRVLLAREPSRAHPWRASLLLPLGLNRVTRHDMRTSIAAGFRGRELARALGLNEGWNLREGDSLLGAHSLRAWRDQPTGTCLNATNTQ